MHNPQKDSFKFESSEKEVIVEVDEGPQYVRKYPKPIPVSEYMKFDKDLTPPDSWK